MPSLRESYCQIACNHRRQGVRSDDSPPEVTSMLLAPTFDAGSPILMTWRDRAACLGVDPELFFPIGNTGPRFSRKKRQRLSAVAVRLLRPA